MLLGKQAPILNLHTHSYTLHHHAIGAFFAQPLSLRVLSQSLVNGELRLETPFGRTRTRGLPSDEGTRELSSIPFAPFFSVSSRVIFFREKENKLLRLFFSSPLLLLSSVPSKSLWRQGARFYACVEGEKTFLAAHLSKRRPIPLPAYSRKKEEKPCKEQGPAHRQRHRRANNFKEVFGKRKGGRPILRA